MTAARDGGGAQEPASGFTARRVPDFARLHALEEARVARWKRQNTKTVTVPLAFRLAPDPAKPGAAAVGTSGAAPESGRGGGASRGREGRAGAEPPDATQHKENEAVQGGRIGAPSAHVLYPRAFQPTCHCRTMSSSGCPWKLARGRCTSLLS